MAEKKVQIKIATEADTSGAEQAKEALDQIAESAGQASEGFGPLLSGQQGAPPFEEWVESAEEAADATDQVSESMEKAADSTFEFTEEEKKAIEEGEKLNRELANQDAAQVKAARSADENAKSLKRIEGAGKALVALQLAEHFQRALGELKKLTAEGGELHGELGHLNPAIDAVGASVSVLSSGFATLASTGNPVAAVLAATAQATAEGTGAYFEMKKAVDNLARATTDFAEQQDFARRMRREMDEQLKREDALRIYTDEADQLERQVRALEQANALRASVNNAALRTAQAEVSIAQSTGGDVAAAQTNVLTARLQAEMDAINSKISEAQARLDAANAASAEAVAKAEDASKVSGKNVEEFNRINREADQAISEANEADKALARTIVEADATKAAVVREIEASLAELNANAGTLSAQAQQAGDQLFSELQSRMSELSNGIPEVTGAAVAPVVAKVEQVSRNIEAERVATTQAVSSIQVPAMNEQAVRAAGGKVEEAVDRMAAAFIAALQKVELRIDGVTGRVGNLETGAQVLRQDMRSIRR